MPSFDIVSQVDDHELTNAVDQTNREVSNRFDFKGSGAHVEKTDFDLVIVAQAEFQVTQILDILQNKMTKRGIDITCLQCGDIVTSGNQARQPVTARTGIDSELGRKIVKQVKEAKLKLQAAIQQDQVRVSGKKRDDLQTMIGTLKQQQTDLPLQFINFRD